MSTLRNLGVGKVLVVALPKVLPGAASYLTSRLTETGIEGTENLPSAKKTAAFAMEKVQDPEKAINLLIPTLVSLAGAQGFITNLGGIAATFVSLPSNIAAMAIVQSHLVAAIAHLRGYDIDDPRVRLAISLCLMGEERVTQCVASGELPSTPLGVATAPILDTKLEKTVNRLVTDSLMASVGGKQAIVLIVKRVPIIGGGIGAANDSWQARKVARFARSQFPSRRPQIPIKLTSDVAPAEDSNVAPEE